jgi:hypothetical protein
MFYEFILLTLSLAAAHTGDSSHERTKMKRKMQKTKKNDISTLLDMLRWI